MRTATVGVTPGEGHPRRSPWLERMRRIATGFSVRTKILGIVLALTTALGLAVTVQVRSVLTDVLITELDNRGRSVVSDLAARTVDPLLLNDAYGVYEMLTDTVSNHPDAFYAFVVDVDGSVVAHTFGDDGFPIELLAVNPGDGTSGIVHNHYRGDIGRFHDFRAPILDGLAGAVRLGLSEHRLATVVDGITAQMLATTVFVGLLGVAAASLLTWLLTRPILELVDTTRQVGEGDLSARASHWSADEIGDLAVAFNTMVADLESNRATIAENEAARTRLLEQLITAQEEERKRIARELHDTVGQALGSLMVGVSMLKKGADPEFLNKGEELQRLAGETLEQVRELSRELRPSALDDLGLAAALSRYTEDYTVRYAEISVDLHVDLPDRLPSHLETALYRVVQEAMTNTARHSGARTLSVLITRRDGTVQTIVEDDGAGFDPIAVRQSGTGVGLHGMQERAELLGGRLEIESGLRGTTLYVEVPV